MGCEPVTVASAAAAAASGPLTPPTVGGVLSSRLSVMSVSAGTGFESAKSHFVELRSVLQLTYASKSRAPCGRVQFSVAVYALLPPQGSSAPPGRAWPAGADPR